MKKNPVLEEKIDDLQQLAESEGKKPFVGLVGKAFKKDLGSTINPKDLLASLPGRGRANNPPIPKEYYEFQWAVYATDDILKQSLTDYQNQKQLGECYQIFYKGKPLDVYPMTAEGIDFVKEKIRNLGIKKSEKNCILHRRLKPKTSQWTLSVWK